jgi:hypothetical protein
MKLKSIATIQSGHITRGRIEPTDDGGCHLLQARDVDAENLSYRVESMARFNPVKSAKDWILRPGDLLFMARGSRNFTMPIKDDLPDDVLAAACFFIIRVSSRMILPEYLCWYLNQEPVARYLHQHTGQSVHMPVVKRAVLEGIDVPVPPLETQKMVAGLAILLNKERMLLEKLARKRTSLIAETCFKAIQQPIDRDDE